MTPTLSEPIAEGRLQDFAGQADAESMGPAGLPLVHPGDVLREDVIPDSRLSKTAFARQLEISREALPNILGRRSAVSPLLAHKQLYAVVEGEPRH